MTKSKIPKPTDRIVIPDGTPIGLCDSNGNEFLVGSIVRMEVDMNKDVHGGWVEHKVVLQGITPLLSYHRSEKGQALPVGYSAVALSAVYDLKMFLFAEDSLSLRPEDEMLIIPPTEGAAK